jgi:FtsH-binding integral membrane protein
LYVQRLFVDDFRQSSGGERVMFQNQTNNPYMSNSASHAAVDVRAAFIRRTYAHLTGAVVAFIAVEAILFAMVDVPMRQQVINTVFGSRFGWLAILFGFMGISWLANSWATTGASSTTQYLGLSLYVVAQALLFAPMLFFASFVSSDAIPTATVITLSTFGGLTAVVFITKSDFSGWGKYLYMAGFAAIGLVICGSIFGMGNGFSMLLSGAFVVLAAGYILYGTSNVVHHYRTDQHVAASLALFASVAMLFWHVLQIVIALSGRD